MRFDWTGHQYIAGVLFIADTNNSVIRYLDLKKKEADLVTLELKGVQPPIPKSRSLKRLRRRSSADTQTITADGTSSNEGNLYIRISVPEGYHFSKVELFLSHVCTFIYTECYKLQLLYYRCFILLSTISL